MRTQAAPAGVPSITAITPKSVARGQPATYRQALSSARSLSRVNHGVPSQLYASSNISVRNVKSSAVAGRSSMAPSSPTGDRSSTGLELDPDEVPAGPAGGCPVLGDDLNG